MVLKIYHNYFIDKAPSSNKLQLANTPTHNIFIYRIDYASNNNEALNLQMF